MKSSTRLDSVVFQLTPTRTRCDLLIIDNGKAEKIATGLLDPFLAHLKTAQDQVSKGGYSIVLKPKDSDNAAWFTKATIQRFVRFVSNPDVLERVYTLETEIMQMREAIGIQHISEVALTVVEDDNLRAKRAESTQECESGNRPLLKFNEEKAIVLYEPDSHPKQANTSDENSKVQVLKVLETRKKVLQKEQGMAFARAVAAGFQVDDMLPLISFAKSFGASRLMDACLKFMDLWKKKHESGQWLEIEATQPNISPKNASGTMLANAANMRRNSWPGTPENNNDVKSPTNVNKEHVQGQHPQPMYAPWPVHSPPGTFPVFQGYTMQGMPYYPYPSPYPSTDDSRRSSGQRKAKKHHSSCSEDSSGSEEDQGREKGKSGRRRKSGKVVIRNINYINSKKKDHSGTESDAEEGAIVVECYNVGKERETKGTEADTGDWQAFQTLLLQDADREERTVDHMMEKDRQGTWKYDDPLALDKREAEERYQERDTQNGTVTRRIRGSSDSFMVHQRENGFENPSDPLNLNGFDNPGNGLDKRSSSVNMDDDSYIVTREAGSSTRNALDIGPEISSYHQADGSERNKISYEPHDLSLMPERETEKLSAGYDPALDFVGSKALKKKNNKEAGVTKRDPTTRLSNDAADKRKASGVIRKGRPTKMSPLDEARARADKLRNFKADLLIIKKEKEEEERKRIEGLKIARQKRIAAKSNSTVVGQSQLSAQQTRKNLSNRFSPGAPRASKFSDTEPGSLSSPLQRRLPIRSASLGSNEPQKVPKNSKLSSGSKSTGNRLTRSISPLPPSKRENIASSNRLTRSTSPLPLYKRETRISLDSQNESVSRTRPKMGSAPSSAVRSLHMAGSRLTRSISPLPLSKRETRVSLDSQNKSVSRTRRLSEPKTGNNSAPGSAVRSLRTIASKKASDAPETKKISAIVNYDIAKIASLPELKIKAPKGPNNVLVKGAEKIKSSAFEIEPFGNKNKPLSQNAVDETPVIEKTVVMVLPSSARSISAAQTEESKLVPGYSTIYDCCPSAGADKKAVETMQESGNDLVLIRPETLSDLITETPKFLTVQNVVEKPYEAPHARVSSLEVPGNSVCSQAPGPSCHSNETAQETVKALAAEKKMSEALEKSQSKESATKGLRKLLKFGKKSRSSSTGKYHTKSNSAAAVSSNKDHESAVTAATTSEAFTLKNLISQDETPTAATASQKSSRHFSLLSPFKNKKRVS
ncbi:COP1-interacting protein 7 isoform X2 [Brassica rapa]|uniref:COP1-interacting protein 7 isoform X2 n=1 Tax=Brassica campestris TaxID=3711 RepID=UPI0004F150A4|nr:COP1-interacting protein 7 isoform X2 [Brassica rapa]XP_048615404.1 COP1-interacting protein 7 isoform X2 [Brassica napus]